MERSSLRHRILNAAAISVVVLFFIQVAIVLIRHDQYFWDFDVYYTAASALWSGENPYAATHPDHPFRYVYPLASLLFFQPLLACGPIAAPVVHCLLQVIVLALVWRHWCKGYLDRSQLAGFTIFFILAFNSCVSSGLRAGNVAILETALVWAAIAFYLRGRLPTFTALVVLSACFKIVTIAYLGLLVLSSRPRRWACLFGGVTGYALVIGLAALAFPDWHQQMVQNIRLLGDASRGALNPSLRECFADLSTLTGLVNLYPLVALLIAAATAWRIFSTSDERLKVMLSITAICLILPRLKDYSYAILILPVYDALTRIQPALVRWVLFAIAVVPTHYVSRYLLGISDEQALRSVPFLFWEYSPLVVLLAAWGYQVAGFVPQRRSSLVPRENGVRSQ